MIKNENIIIPSEDVLKKYQIIEGSKTAEMYKNSNMIKYHFWITLLDHAVSRAVKPEYFARLYNDSTLFESKSDRSIKGKNIQAD